MSLIECRFPQVTPPKARLFNQAQELEVRASSTIMDTSRPHALAFAFPAQGHINPMMHLCSKLASMGFLITFVNAASFHKKIAQQDVSDCFHFRSIPDDCLPKMRLDSTTVDRFLKAMEEGMRNSFEELLKEVNEEYPVTCIISDVFMYWTQDVAFNFGICRVSVWTSSAAISLLSRKLDLLEREGVIGKNRRGDVEIIDFIHGLPPIPVAALPAVFRDPDAYEKTKQERLRRYAILNKDAWVLANTFYELEKEQIDEMRIEKLPNFTPVGLFVSWEDQLVTASNPGLWNEDGSCLEWLDEQPRKSVLYISFGSLATLSLEQLREIYKGLLLANQRFLWVIRADTLDKENERNELVQEIKQSNKGMVVSWAPQLQVLQHESVVAFLSHCGWNSVTEAVRFGVPFLCWPCIAEQSLNAFTVVEHWKIGFYVREHQETNANVLTRADRIEEVVRKIMGEEGDALRSRVKLFSDQAAAALAPGGSSDSNLQAFLQDMKLRASQMKSNGTVGRLGP